MQTRLSSAIATTLPVVTPVSRGACRGVHFFSLGGLSGHIEVMERGENQEAVWRWDAGQC
jgi:hypothetical protein